jgi:hypothetical protein
LLGRCPNLAFYALQPGLDLVALDLAGGAARQLRERDEADVLGLLVAGKRIAI